MKIDISPSARELLTKKQEFYRHKNRKPCLVQVAKTCEGAKFALVYALPESGETAVTDAGLEIYVAPRLLTEYGGFTLDTEDFFFSRRLLITPVRQSFQCDCQHKCNEKQREDK